MHLDQLFQKINSSDDLSEITFPDSWCQGRTGFGGMSAALVYLAMKKQVANDRDIRSLSVNFVGPLLADCPFSIEVEMLREGKSSSMLSAKAIQEGKVCLVVQACFAKARPSKIEIQNHVAIDLPAPDEKRATSYDEKSMPAFLQHFNLDVIEGQMPFTGSQYSALGGWMRLLKVPAELTEAHIISLIDAWPPATLQMANGLAMASTMTWTIDFIQPRKMMKSTDWLAYQCETLHSSSGYGTTDANIWSQAGDLVAVSRQCVTVFA